jgi:murein DD-endopeptidase MepM/ murein hydrolase activator NlpD
VIAPAVIGSAIFGAAWAHDPAPVPEASMIEEPGLRLQGTFAQGGLLFGRTEPGASVTLDGASVRVSPTGIFVIGFGRDHGHGSELELRFADGAKIARTLSISRRAYNIQKINGLPSAQVTPPKALLDRIRRENVLIGDARAHDSAETWFAGGFIWPALGPISGVYGSQRILNGKPRQPHFGVDVAGPVGTPIVAPAPGRVVLSETDMFYTGGTIIIDHGHGLTSAFLHMSNVNVAVGDMVAVGQSIGEIGATGRVTGPHLDWRINWGKIRIDPQLLVPPMESVTN